MSGPNHLVTSIGSMSAESVISSLRSSTGGHITGCSIYPMDWTASSSLLDAFYQIPPASAQNYVQELLRVCILEHVNYVFPLTDPEVDALDGQLALFTKHGITLCMQEQKANAISRDKFRVFETFKDNPSVYTIPTWTLDDLPNNPLPFPLIAKPRCGRSSQGIGTLDDIRDLRYFITKHAHNGYIVQPKLDGEIYVVDVLRDDKSGACVTITRRELIRTSNGAGLTVEMIPNSSINKIAAVVAEHLSINGCINIEFIVKNNIGHLMDINPRFSAGVGFSRLAGYDMTANHLRCFVAKPIDASIIPPDAIYTRRWIDVTAPHIIQG